MWRVVGLLVTQDVQDANFVSVAVAIDTSLKGMPETGQSRSPFVDVDYNGDILWAQ